MIKENSNSEVRSFCFKGNPAKDNLLTKILKAYEIEEVYLCIYSVRNKNEEQYDELLKDIKNKHVQGTKRFKDIFIEIQSYEIQDFFDELESQGFSFDEISVWSKYTSFDMFVKEEKFFDEHIEPTVPTFYLNRNFYESNFNEIICDKQFNDVVTREILEKILV